MSARQILDAAMTEKAFMDAVIELAETYGWLWAHVPDKLYKLAAKEGRIDAMGGAKGLPDLIMVHPADTWRPIIFAELKTEKGTVQPEQTTWLEALDRGHMMENYVVVRLWRPSDMPEIIRVLSGEEDA